MLFRDQARRLIAAKYFTGGERTALCTLLDIPVPTESQMLRETAALEQSAAVEKGREARFRLTVIPACNYTCALTGYRLVTVTSGSIVDAAHIHQFAAPALFPGFAPTLDSGHWTLDNSTRPGPILAFSLYNLAFPRVPPVGRSLPRRPNVTFQPWLGRFPHFRQFHPS